MFEMLMLFAFLAAAASPLLPKGPGGDRSISPRQRKSDAAQNRPGALPAAVKPSRPTKTGRRPFHCAWAA